MWLIPGKVWVTLLPLVNIKTRTCDRYFKFRKGANIFSVAPHTFLLATLIS